MAFTYSGNPGQSPIDAVRFAIGDTDPARPQLQDGEIAYCLDLSGGNVVAASVTACQAVITQLSRMCDQTVGSVSKSFSQLLAGYRGVLDNLRRTAANSGSGGIPFVGGISVTANNQPYHNRDYVRPQFTTRMMHGRYSATANPALGDISGTGGNQDER